MVEKKSRLNMRMTDAEFERLKKRAARSGLSASAFIRFIIDGLVPQELPSPEYFEMKNSLLKIGGLLNQIAKKANVTAHIDTEKFETAYSEFQKQFLEIQTAVTAPQKLKSALFADTERERKLMSLLESAETSIIESMKIVSENSDEGDP